MSLPGFQADKSLYRTNGQYRASLTSRQNQGLVTPAFVDQSCYGDCFNTCYTNGTMYWGWSAEDAQTECANSCNQQCYCRPYTITSHNGLCTTDTTCCGSECTSETTCIPTPIPTYPNSRLGAFLTR